MVFRFRRIVLLRATVVLDAAMAYLALAPDVYPLVRGLAFFVALFGTLYVLRDPPRLILADDGLTFRRSLKPDQRWQWHEVAALRLMATPMGRPVISFRPPGKERCYFPGPWTVDELTVYSAILWCKNVWEGGGMR